MICVSENSASIKVMAYEKVETSEFLFDPYKYSVDLFNQLHSSSCKVFTSSGGNVICCRQMVSDEVDTILFNVIDIQIHLTQMMYRMI